MTKSKFTFLGLVVAFFVVQDQQPIKNMQNRATTQ